MLRRSDSGRTDLQQPERQLKSRNPRRDHFPGTSADRDPALSEDEKTTLKNLPENQDMKNRIFREIVLLGKRLSTNLILLLLL